MFVCCIKIYDISYANLHVNMLFGYFNLMKLKLLNGRYGGG